MRIFGVGLLLAASAVAAGESEQVNLGRWLFFDPRLSSDGRISCASCHRPEAGFSDVTATSAGVKGRHGRRKSMTLIDLAENGPYFWDGRAATLEEQAIGPLLSADEMGSTEAQVLATVRGIKGYRVAFERAFGDAKVDLKRIAQALAAYQSTITAPPTTFNQSRLGSGRPYPPEAQEGFELFVHRGCGSCHNPARGFSDGKFHNLGVGYRNGTFADAGRFEVTKDSRDLGAFKTPALEQVGTHPPFMHDGSLATLSDVIDFYDRGGVENPSRSPRIRKLGLTAREKRLMRVFLETLSSSQPPQQAALDLPR
jgi:cytochrome c peroxidase